MAGPGASELESFSAAFAYDEHMGRILLAGKNGGQRDVLRFLARVLESRLPHVVSRARIDLVTWVPASRSRARRRGYDQGEVLARVLARRLGLPARRLLVRSSAESQANRGRKDRLAGPKLRPIGTVPRRILLVDDVATTGASLAAAARTLRPAGADLVHGAVVALADRGDRLY